MYNEKPWTLSASKRGKSAKKSKTKTMRNDSLYVTVLGDLKNQPETVINTDSLMKKYGCAKHTAFKCIQILKRNRKIKLVSVQGEGASIKAEYQFVKGSKEAIKMAPQKGYMSVSGFLKKKKVKSLNQVGSEFRTFLIDNKVSARLGTPRKAKLSLVYSVDDLEKYYNKFINKEVKTEIPDKNSKVLKISKTDKKVVESASKTTEKESNRSQKKAGFMRNISWIIPCLAVLSLRLMAKLWTVVCAIAYMR